MRQGGEEIAKGVEEPGKEHEGENVKMKQRCRKCNIYGEGHSKEIKISMETEPCIGGRCEGCLASIVFACSYRVLPYACISLPS